MIEPLLRAPNRRAGLLDLQGAGLSEVDFLLKFLIRQNGVTELVLAGNPVRDAQMTPFLEGLLHFKPAVKALDLSGTRLSAESMRTVERLFLQESLLRVLVLDENRIGTDAFIAVMHATRKSTRVHELSFVRCGITIDANEDAAKDLLESMSQNCSIHRLALEGNVVHDAVLTDLAVELDKNQGIVEKIFPLFELSLIHI